MMVLTVQLVPLAQLVLPVPRAIQVTTAPLKAIPGLRVQRQLQVLQALLVLLVRRAKQARLVRLVPQAQQVTQDRMARLARLVRFVTTHSPLRRVTRIS